MATLQVENLPDELYHRIQTLAREHNATLNQVVIELLTQAVQPNSLNPTQNPHVPVMAELLQSIRSRPRVNPANVGLPDSTALIREDRSR